MLRLLTWRSKNITEFDGMNFDYVIALCDKARREYQAMRCWEKLEWNFEDPQFQQCANPF